MRQGTDKIAPMLSVLLSLLACDPGETPVAPGTITTVMGTGDMGYNGGGGEAVDTWLYLPTTVSLALDGVPLVVDFNNMLIRELRDGKAITVAGNALHEYSVPGNAALDSPLENPFDARYGSDGLLYILPNHENRLLRVNREGVIEVIAGTGDEGYSGDGGDCLFATFGQPGSFDIDADGVIWVADTLNYALRRVGADGIVTTVVSDLGQPQRVRVFDGAVYVTDELLGAIIRYDPISAEVTTELEGLSIPWGVEFTADGTMYVADSGNNQVLKVSRGDVEVVAGTGEGGFSGDGGLAVDAELDWPADIAITSAGEIYIADMRNARVRMISAPAD